jgi:hypothetical protein
LGLAVERELTIDDLYNSSVVSIRDVKDSELTIILAHKTSDGTIYKRHRVSRKFLDFIDSFCEASTCAYTHNDPEQLDLFKDNLNRKKNKR